MSDSHQLDPRRHAYRGDLAAVALQGRVEAPRFVEGVEAQVCVLAAPVRRRPEAMAPLDTEALFGENLIVYDDQRRLGLGSTQTRRLCRLCPVRSITAQRPFAHSLTSARR